MTAALTVSIMNNYLLVPPPNAFTLPTVRETVHLAGFLAVAVGLGTAVEGMKQAREEAASLLHKDPDLARPEHVELGRALDRRWRDKLHLARVS